MLKEILEAFLGKCRYSWGNASIQNTFAIEELRGEVKITLEEKNDSRTTIYRELISYEKLYALLVPKHKLEYLYLFQDVMREYQEEDSKPYMVRQSLNEILIRMGSTFVDRKQQMEKEVIPIPKEQPLMTGVKFVENGVEYEQLALF